MDYSNCDSMGNESQKDKAKVEAYNLANQEVTYTFDDYGNVTGVYVDGIFNREATDIVQEAVRTRNVDLLKGFGAGFLDQLSKNNGQALLDELFGERFVSQKLKGTAGHDIGRVTANIFSLAQSGAEFLGGGLWFLANGFAGTATAPETGGVSLTLVPNAAAQTGLVWGHAGAVAVSAWGGLNSGSYGGANNNVNNMDEFFKTDFGSELKKNLTKTTKRIDGQSVYKVDSKKAKELGLNKGDQIYLDGLHKDHLEVFNSKGKFEKVLNLDGSVNVDKTIRGLGRRLK
ncbi:hypothetical protein [Enterococcus rivorum]|uniref:hypothetical protein n=1 Tax=Enterococcus rivorum TaxID=762845 RepID=UPI0036383294